MPPSHYYEGILKAMDSLAATPGSGPATFPRPNLQRRQPAATFEDGSVDDVPTLNSPGATADSVVDDG